MVKKRLRYFSEDPIVLIGPMCAGKSSIAELLSETLEIPRLEVDKIRWKYYKEIGYDEREASRIATSELGTVGLLTYWKPFEAHAVKRILKEVGCCVIDFGAGHSVYEDEVLFAEVEKALAPIQNIFLLLPSPNLDESIEILNTRFNQLLQDNGIPIENGLLALNETFVRHPSNQKLAKKVIYTEGKTPEQTCGEIIKLLEINL